MKKKAIIISIKGFKLTNKEKLLFTKESPWGLILFKRNIKSLPQVRLLIKNIKKITKDNKFPILIDEEGSTVTRLSKIINHNIDANFFGKLYLSNKNLKEKYYNRQNINQIINNKITDLPVLSNDTDNIIEFNNSINEDTYNKKPRSFWNLLKSK